MLLIDAIMEIWVYNFASGYAERRLGTDRFFASAGAVIRSSRFHSQKHTLTQQFSVFMKYISIYK